MPGGPIPSGRGGLVAGGRHHTYIYIYTYIYIDRYIYIYRDIYIYIEIWPFSHT